MYSRSEKLVYVRKTIDSLSSTPASNPNGISLQGCWEAVGTNVLLQGLGWTQKKGGSEEKQLKSTSQKF
jgi:hypothetical protein